MNQKMPISESEVNTLLQTIAVARNNILQRHEQKKAMSEQYRKYSELLRDRRYEIEKQHRELEYQGQQIINGLDEEIKKIESSIADARHVLVRRVTLAGIKEAMQDPSNFDAPVIGGDREFVKEGFTGPLKSYDARIFFQNSYILLYEILSDTRKPGNKVAYHISAIRKVKWNLWNVIAEAGGAIGQRTYSGYDDNPLVFSREFKTEEEANAYAAKHRERLTQEFCPKLIAFEDEIKKADNLDDIMDLRLVVAGTTGKHHFSSHRENAHFAIKEATKTQLVLRRLWNYSTDPDEGKEEEDYEITISWVSGLNFSITGHRLSSEAEAIGKFLEEYFALPKAYVMSEEGPVETA